jgi:uncharacterized protein YndB with AHSA1/START domain
MKTTTPEPHLLVGTWITDDEYGSDVEYIINQSDKSMSVEAVDMNDGERAEIRDVQWDDDITLTFTAYWASTGRFAKCKFTLSSENRVHFTFTYTDHDTLHRKQSNKPLELVR